MMTLTVMRSVVRSQSQRPRARSARRLGALVAVAAAALVAVVLSGLLASRPTAAQGAVAPAAYVPGEVIVGYAPSTTAQARIATAITAGATEAGATETEAGATETAAPGAAEAGAPAATGAAEAAAPTPAEAAAEAAAPTPAEAAAEAAVPAPATRVLRLRPGVGVPTALARLRSRPGVVWAVPDYIATTTDTADPANAAAANAAAVNAGAPAVTSGTASTTTTATATAFPVPNDPGLGRTPGGWEQLQWNFVGPFGVNALQAWANLAADGRPGGRGVTVAVLDTGVAYANRGRFRRSPDFTPYQFVRGYDFVAGNPYPNDRNGHGTDVAGTIAEATDNHRDLTGLAYGVRLMPVRVLNSEGEGDASTIAEGVRFAVRHGARVINLSLEFTSGVTASDIPELIEALRYAHRHNVVVVAAAGNESHATIAYPARGPDVISVGASTEHGCLASYSNAGPELTIVAPGGGPDAELPGDPNCHPELPPGRDIFQVTFVGSSPRRFGIPTDYEGTSMAAPHVAATVAMIIASGVLGRHPTPARIVARLRATARKLGGPEDRLLYGAGLLDAGAATAPGGPGAVLAKRRR